MANHHGCWRAMLHIKLIFLTHSVTIFYVHFSCKQNHTLCASHRILKTSALPIKIWEGSITNKLVPTVMSVCKNHHEVKLLTVLKARYSFDWLIDTNYCWLMWLSSLKGCIVLSCCSLHNSSPSTFTLGTQLLECRQTAMTNGRYLIRDYILGPLRMHGLTRVNVYVTTHWTSSILITFPSSSRLQQLQDKVAEER